MDRASAEATGERVIEELYRDSDEAYLIYLFHIATYEFARGHVKGKDVLDFGCGSGYGAHRIAPECRSILGVDISRDAINYAKGHYSADNLSYLCVRKVEEEGLPFRDEQFDVVLSFQVIEHVPNPSLYLSEIDRVVKQGGVVIIATPDRTTRLFPWQKPWNRWHVREYDAPALETQLREFFSDVEMFHMGGSSVLEIELRRTARMKWLTLPITLPFIPEYARVRALSLLRRLKAGPRGQAKVASSPPFDISDLAISPNASPSVNLVAIVHKQPCLDYRRRVNITGGSR